MTAADERRAAIALYEHGLLAFWQGADEEACSLHGRSLHLARRLGDPTSIALALCGLARVALREDLEWAQTLCEEALQTVAGTDDQAGRADALHVLALAARLRGDLCQHGGRRRDGRLADVRHAPGPVTFGPGKHTQRSGEASHEGHPGGTRAGG